MLLCGSDLVKSFLTPGVWIVEQVRQLLIDFGVVCVTREDFEISSFFETSPFDDLKERVHFVHDLEFGSFSSTLVRERIRKALDISQFVNRSVRNYISQHGLYQNVNSNTP